MEGYRDLFQGVGRLMREGDGSIERNHLRVALGSARIAIYDAVPLTLRLIERLGASEGVVLDYGCGNALYLIALCAQHPGLRAVGVELAQETVDAARAHVREAGLQERITIEHASAPDYVPSEEIDFVVSAFVLHEIVGQRGVEGTVEFLQLLRAALPRRAPAHHRGLKPLRGRPRRARRLRSPGEGLLQLLHLAALGDHPAAAAPCAVA